MSQVVETSSLRRTQEEVSLEFQIPDFFLSGNVNFKSPIFYFCNPRWCMILYPNGGLCSIYKEACFRSLKKNKDSFMDMFKKGNQYNGLLQADIYLSPTSQEQPEEAVPRPIHQAAAKQLIGAMLPNEVLCVIVRPENFEHLSLDFNKFLAIIRGGDQQNLIFYLDNLTQDLCTALQGYYQIHPSIIQTIGVKDPVDFHELAEKTGPGFSGSPKSNTEPTRTYSNVHDFFAVLGISPNGKLRAEPPWYSLSADRIKKAFEYIPKQVGKVECAANSSARALILGNARDDMADFYDIFKDGCPKDIETIYSSRVAPITLGLGMLLAPFTAGISMGVAVGATGLAAATAKIVETGPSPWELAKYINHHIPIRSPFEKAIVQTYSCFSDCAKSMASDMRTLDPVIAFIFWGPTAWHYANVVAVKGNLDRIEGFILLETDQSLDYRTYDNMEHIMYNAYKFNSSFCVGGTPNNYNLIRFVRR